MGYDKVWKIKKMMVFQRKYGQQTNDDISKELWMMKKKDGFVLNNRKGASSDQARSR